MDLFALKQTEAAKLLGKTPRTLRDWEASGEVVPRNPDGTYPGPALVAWWIGKSVGDELDGNRERARKDKESADKLALENSRTRGELGVITEISEWYGQHVDRATLRLEQIPDALGQFCDSRTAAKVVPECRRLIHEACSELAEDSGASGTADIEAMETPTHRVRKRVGRPQSAPIERE